MEENNIKYNNNSKDSVNDDQNEWSFESLETGEYMATAGKRYFAWDMVRFFLILGLIIAITAYFWDPLYYFFEQINF